MKITKEQFEEMKAKYDKEVKKGKPAKGPRHDIENQTNWESYSKEDLMEVLNQDGVIGLKFHLTEYTQKVAEEFHGADAAEYVGRINLVYSPIYADSGADRSGRVEGGDEYYDRGTTCPPTCQ
ncbi:molecular chaperone DnaK [Algoriphagus aestuariicola]|uniref:Molecular chaperone DnaK n=1 Tax=Algoriphagus aestuariicola TaxID=1852016 RepID=A0ABS3BSP1_9BACT|nr:molecular chaperone DnaK [Algoriphagus aestuariicola]MBN7802133.1 molecular chaperone DnaK [Algoriphagus aestuariicola]